MVAAGDAESPRLDFFISYATRDRPWAEWIAWKLSDAGYDVFLEDDVRPGQDWTATVNDAIERSRTFIAVVSGHYLERQAQTTQEWSAAFVASSTTALRVVPVLVEPVELPPIMRTLFTVSLFDLDEEQARSALLSGLNPSPRRPVAAAAFPSESTVQPRPVPAPPQAPRRDKKKVFISYSHVDSVWLDRLLVFLRPLEISGRIILWSDRDIAGGRRWLEEIREALDTSGVAIPLVSSDFLASEFIAAEELPRLLQAAERDGTAVLPLIVRPSRFHRTPVLSSFQAVNPPNNPLSGMRVHQREQVLVRLSDLIEDVVS